MAKSLNPDDYMVAWICVQEVVHTAILIMLDGEHGSIPGSPKALNPYILGSVAGLSVVVTIFPESDTDGLFLTHIRATFPKLETAILVTTGGGVPAIAGNTRIRPGDVVVTRSKSVSDSLGSILNDGEKAGIGPVATSGALRMPSKALMDAMQSSDDSRGSSVREHIEKIDTEVSYLSIYRNPNVEDGDDEPRAVIHQSTRAFGEFSVDNSEVQDPLAEDGTWPSGNAVVKGLANLSSVVVQGISNDCHSNSSNEWLGYPAAIAAAYVRQLSIHICASIQMESSKSLSVREKDIADYQRVAWLTPTDFSLHQAEYTEQRFPGTCLWILASREYHTWLLGNSHHTLFCSGKSGTGKTISASTVIQYLETRFRGDMTTGVAYIYFSTIRPGEQDLQNLILCLMKQLVQGLPEIPDSITGLKRIRYRAVDFKDVLGALYRTVERLLRVYIILDAIDEYSLNDRNRFLREMSRLQVKYGVKIFLTSKHVSEGINRLKNILKLEIRAEAQDLRRYVVANIFRLPSSVQGSIEMKNQLISRIVEWSGERFLLAKLYLDLLAGNESPNAVLRRPSASLPGSKAYDLAYAMIMELVEGQSPERVDLARRALSWLTFATRQLTLSELQDALALIKAGDFDAGPPNRPKAEDIITACCGLVTLCPASGIIQLLHRTAREYLSRPCKPWLQISESYLGETCVAYLLLERFKDGVCQNTNDFSERVRCSPLYEYAAKNWGKHLSKTLPLSQSTTTFLTDRPKVEAACQAAMKPHQYWYSSWSWMTFQVKMASDLAVAAFAGAEAIVEALLSRGMDVNTTDSLGNTPLSWVAQRGYERIVELLLADQRTDVDCRNHDGRTPILLAAKAGRDKVVGRLLEHGANPNLKDLEKVSPLWYAAEAGHATVVKLLLARNLRDLNLLAGYTNYRRNTPLSIAVWNGHTEVVKILLSQHGVDKRAKDHAYYGKSDELLTQAVKIGDDEIAEFLYHQTCMGGLDPIDNEAAEALLHCAAKVGSEKMVRLLLSGHQIDPNCRSTGSLTPLMTAIEAGRGGEPILRLLLDTEGIKPDLRDEKGRTALLLAATLGNERAVDILLANTAIDPNCKDDSGRTALSWAAEGLHEHIVEKLLVVEGVDPDNEDITGQTPLLYACNDLDPSRAIKLREREAVVRQLLATGRVNLNARGYNRKTPIMMTVGAGNDALVRIFLSHSETDLDAKDADGENIVQQAGFRGKWAIVELLLETGRFDLNYRMPYDGRRHSRSGHTILSIAMRGAPEAMTKRLLSKRGIEVNAQDNDGSTLLASAVRSWRFSVMEQLLAMEGINPNLKDEWGHTPLSAAVCHWSEKATDLLLKFNGIDPETQDRDGRTPLSLAAERGLVKIVKLLLSVGKVDPDSRDKTGRSPLSWAICPSWETTSLPWENPSLNSTADGRKEVARQLLQTNRINPNAEDDEG